MKSGDQKNVKVSMDEMKKLIKKQGDNVLAEKEFFDYILRLASKENLNTDFSLYRPIILKMVKDKEMVKNFKSLDEEE